MSCGAIPMSAVRSPVVMSGMPSTTYSGSSFEWPKLLEPRTRTEKSPFARRMTCTPGTRPWISSSTRETRIASSSSSEIDAIAPVTSERACRP
jgi:hypothetical protein